MAFWTAALRLALCSELRDADADLTDVSFFSAGATTRATGRTGRDTDLELRVEDAGSTGGSGPRASRAGGHVDEDVVVLMVLLVLTI